MTTVYQTDRLLLRATAGLPLEGKLDIERLIANVQRCCQWKLQDCASCAAIASVITLEGSK